MNMNKEVEAYYNEYKRRIVLLLSMSGMWPGNQPRVLQIFLNLLSSLTALIVFCSICGFCYCYITDIKAVIKGLGYLNSNMLSFLKVTVLALRQDDIKKLNHNLLRLFENDLEIPENRPHLLAHYRTFSKFFKTIYYYSGVALGMNAIKPLLVLRHGKHVTAHTLLLPFDYEEGGLPYWIVYGLEALVDFYVWCNTVGPDSLFGMYALHLVGELRLLSYRFRNLKPGSKNYRKNLKECVDRNVILKESKVVLQQLFGFLSLFFAVTCAIIICSVVFQIAQSKELNAHRIVFLILYALVKLIQSFNLAWFGNIITVESEICLDSIYHADWAGSGNVRAMKDILIIQSQNPMQVEVMGVMIIRLDMFTKMINTSVSYFFLLQTLDQNTVEAT